MTKNIAVYLDFLPNPTSCDVGEDGYIISKRQVYGFNKTEVAVLLAALDLAKALDAEITIYSIGNEQPKDLVARALALGLHNSLHIGNFTWQGDIPVAAKVNAFCQNAAPFDILLTANSAFAAMVGENLNLPAATSISKLDVKKDSLTVIRKLPRGKRQQVQLSFPAVLALVATTEDLPLPSVEALKAAQAKAQPAVSVDYADLYRELAPALASAPNFQPLALAPATKIIWQPNSRLSAGQRLAQFTEGAVQARHGKLVTGNPKECAQSMIEYMLAEGLIVKKN